MPGPEVVGESQRVPGAWDVRTANGDVVAVAPDVARAQGLILPTPAAPGNITTPTPAAPVQQQEMSPAQAAAQAEVDAQAARIQADPSSQQGPGRAFVDPNAMGLAPVEESDLRTTPAQRAAMDRQAEAQAEVQAAEQRQTLLSRLAQAAGQGDPRATAQLFEMSGRGDGDARQILERFDRFQRAGILRPGGGGGGGPRSTQTDTRRFTGPAREATPEEAAEMQRLRQEQDAIEREQMVGLAGEAEAESRAMEESARLMDEADLRLRRMQEQAQLAERARQQEMDRRGQQLDDLAKIARESKLEPGRILARGQTGNRFNAAMAIVLGGLGDAFTGGSAGLTTALSIIDKAVDQDVEAQRAQLQTNQQAVANAQSLLGQARQRFGDERAAEAAARDAILAGLQRQIEAQMQRSRGEARDSQLRQLMAELEARRNGLRQQALQAGLGEREVVVQEQLRRGGGGGGRRVDFSALVDERPEVTESGRSDFAVREAGARETLEIVRRARDMMNSTNLAGRLMGEAPAATVEAQELEGALGELALPLATAVFGSTNEEGVDYIGRVYGLQRDIPVERLAALLDRVEQRAMRELETAQLSASPETIEENRSRRETIRRRVAQEDGRAEDVAPSFRPTGGGR